MAVITPAGHGLGYRKSVRRPALAFPRAQHVAAAVPPYVDLSHLNSFIKDQGRFGTCTANSCCGMFEHELRRQGVSVPQNEPKSRAFLYYNSGMLEGDTTDDGRDPYYVFQAMQEYGICNESFDPYTADDILGRPSPEAYAAASHRRATSWAQIGTDIDSLKAALASGYTVAFAFVVYESFEGNQAATTGVVPVPQAGEQQLGGHQIYACGYSDVDFGGIPAGHVKLANSWGTGFGAQGYVFIPYEMVAPAIDGMPMCEEMFVLEYVSHF